MTLMLCTCAKSTYAQISLSANYGGGWTQWKSYDNLQIYGNYGSFTLGTTDGEFLFKFSIYDRVESEGGFVVGSIPSKSKDWLVFDGTVEYYINDEYLTPEALFSENKRAQFISPNPNSKRPQKLVKSSAKIKIAPYKKHPKVYNFFYDNVALGIDLGNIYFKY